MNRHGSLILTLGLLLPALLLLFWPALAVAQPGRRLVEHGGAFAGYSAEVALLPDSKIGFVVLTNRLSALPSIATQLVPQYLLGELPPAASETDDLKPYLGRYVANFANFWNEIFTISERNGRLVLDIPSQLESALNPPRADGRRSLVMTDRLALSFDRIYREVGGVRVPYRTIESTDMSGRMIFEVERVEVGVELAPDTFTLPPSTDWGRRK